MEFGEKVRLLRRKHDLSQDSLATILKINRNCLSRIETGKSEPSLSVIRDIAEYFNFASQSYFISCFKKATGQTPLEYRQHHYQTYTKPVHDSPETL